VEDSINNFGREDARLKSYEAELYACDGRFGWSSMRVTIPKSVVDRIQADADRITVKTPLGDIVAEASSDSDNPGVWISLHRDGEDYESTLALVEYTATEADQKGPQLITRVWGDAQQEDYTDRVVHSGLGKDGAANEC